MDCTRRKITVTGIIYTEFTCCSNKCAIFILVTISYISSSLKVFTATTAAVFMLTIQLEMVNQILKKKVSLLIYSCIYRHNDDYQTHVAAYYFCKSSFKLSSSFLSLYFIIPTYFMMSAVSFANEMAGLTYVHHRQSGTIAWSISWCSKNSWRRWSGQEQLKQ